MYTIYLHLLVFFSRKHTNIEYLCPIYYIYGKINHSKNLQIIDNENDFWNTAVSYNISNVESLATLYIILISIYYRYNILIIL